MNIIETFFLAFVPLFVAIDILGVVPIFLKYSQGMTDEKRKILVRHSCLTALLIALLFLFLGKALIRFLGITESDFRVSGGLILLILAIQDLVVQGEDPKPSVQSSDFGIVPIAIPMIMGPAAFTAILILVDTYGTWMTLISLILNILIVFLVFNYSKVVFRVLGPSGSKIIAKVAALFLAAIGVMMIRVGIVELIRSF